MFALFSIREFAYVGVEERLDNARKQTDFRPDRRGLACRRRSRSSTRRFNYSLGVEYSEWWLTGYHTAAGNHTYSAAPLQC